MRRRFVQMEIEARLDYSTFHLRIFSGLLDCGVHIHTHTPS
jgi:hypothetical protein